MALVLAAGAIFALGLGICNALPLFISAINSSTAMGYATISLAFGVQQLMWGVAQPVAGAMADRWGPRPVMIGGALMLAAGTALIPLATSPWALILVLGVLFAAGAGTAGPAQLASAVSRLIPEPKPPAGNPIIRAPRPFSPFLL